MRVGKIKRSDLRQIWDVMRGPAGVVFAFPDLERAADLVVGVEDDRVVKERTTVAAEQDSVANELAPAPTTEEGARAHRRRIEFGERLRSAVNACSMESGSDTPDFILAAFLGDVLEAFDRGVKGRNKCYRKEAATASTEPQGPGVDRDLIEHARMIFREAMERDPNFGVLTKARVVAALAAKFPCVDANGHFDLAGEILRRLFEE